MTQQELAYWQDRIEQDEVLDASPDPDYDLHEECYSDAEAYWYASRGV